MHAVPALTRVRAKWDVADIFSKSRTRAAWFPVSENGAVDATLDEDCAKREAGGIATVERPPEAGAKYRGNVERGPAGERGVLKVVSARKTETSRVRACSRCFRRVRKQIATRATTTIAPSREPPTMLPSIAGDRGSAGRGYASDAYCETIRRVMLGCGVLMVTYQ